MYIYIYIYMYVCVYIYIYICTIDGIFNNHVMIYLVYPLFVVVLLIIVNWSSKRKAIHATGVSPKGS